MIYVKFTRPFHCLDPDNPRDVIDYYLLEIKANKQEPESIFKLNRKFHDSLTT